MKNKEYKKSERCIFEEKKDEKTRFIIIHDIFI